MEKITKEDLNKAYFELYELFCQKVMCEDEYDILPETLDTLEKLKKEVDINKPPFLVSKILHCSVCGEPIKRTKNFKKVVCFNCKKSKQKEYNLLNSARSHGQKSGG